MLSSCTAIKKLALHTRHPFYIDELWENFRLDEGGDEQIKLKNHLGSVLLEDTVVTQQLLDNLDHPLMPISLSQLHTFITAISWDEGVETSIRQTQIICLMSALSLREVSISLSAIPWASRLDLSRLVCLQTLRLNIERMEIPIAVEHAGDLLETIPRESSLRQVTFRLIGFPYTGTPVGRWSRIDKVLGNERIAPNLRSVEIRFVVGINQKDNWLARIISFEMGGLQSKKRLSFLRGE
ncbi:hypothetical protein C0991_002092 [Blastosporella zonata]|nr:hypothetical protein C0991_002092 [Blastosporella zonata]